MTVKLEKVDDKTAYKNLLVKYAELENKIADIKANCDLAIEGRDIKIKELEKGCEETQELLDKQIEATYKLDKKNEELEQQIEKMKCCWNCKYGENSENKLPCSSCNKNWIVRKRLKKLSDKWEIKENE